MGGHPEATIFDDDDDDIDGKASGSGHIGGEDSRKKTSSGISDATRDAARARLLVLSEAGDDAELLEKVSEANSTPPTTTTTTATSAQIQSGDAKADCCRSKLMAIADTLPPDPATAAAAAATTAAQ